MRTRILAGLGFFFVGGTTAWPQQYLISTIAGGAPPPTPVAAVDAPIALPLGVATDAAGSVFFGSLNCVFKLEKGTVLTRVAGNSRPGYSGDGGSAIDAQLNSPYGLATDADGNLFIADWGNARIRRVSREGRVTTVAGNGAPGYSGDDGPAENAQLKNPLALSVDSAGNLYIADAGNDRIRRVPRDGIITTVAGNGTPGFSGDGGPASKAQLQPAGVAADGAGNLYIPDRVNARIRKVSRDGIITTVAGNGALIKGAYSAADRTFNVSPAYSGDGGPATSAQLYGPLSIALDDSGNLYFADGGAISVALDNSGHSYFAGGGVIRKISPSAIITTVAGYSPTAPFTSLTAKGRYSGDGGPATKAQFNVPYGIALDKAGNLYIADEYNNRIRKVSSDGTIITVAGDGTAISYSGDGGLAAKAQLKQPTTLALDSAGNLYIADWGNNRIRKVSPRGNITTVAGDGTVGYSGDGGPATNAQLRGQPGLTVDTMGNLYIADVGNNRVRKVSPGGIITTVAGAGKYGYSGDGGPATSAGLSGPAAVAVDGAGNLYIAEGIGCRVRKVSPDGIISTVAGNGKFGYSGDGGPAVNAELAIPRSLALGSDSSLYIADSSNSRIRKISPDGVITTVAGGDASVPAPKTLEELADALRILKTSGGGLGDGGSATEAQLRNPVGVAADSSGNLYIADLADNRIRKVSPGGIVTTILGGVSAGYFGDGGAAANAQVKSPSGVAVDSNGDVYVADSGNDAIRLLNPQARPPR